jgi:hypothetical protein
MMTCDQQLELGFRSRRARPERRRRVRAAVAQWWFARMRSVVAEAMDEPPRGASVQGSWLDPQARSVKV